MVYSSRDKIKEVAVKTPGLSQEPGLGEKGPRLAPPGQGQRYPKKGFATKPKRGRGGVSGVPSSAAPGQPDQKPTAGEPVKVSEAARTQDGQDVFAMKPDEWKKRQAKILGRSRVL